MEAWGNIQHGEEVKLDEDETSALANKPVVKLQRKFSEKVLTAAAEPWKPGTSSTARKSRWTSKRILY